MPHVIVKLWPGKSEAQKKNLFEEVTKAVMSTLNYGRNRFPWGLKRSNRSIGRRRFTSQTFKPDTIYLKSGEFSFLFSLP
jgi:4-oxalocrotonate tautomerase